ncbi:unnamed protein product [Chondrus crispus]|uniref:Uncharacterized protein n=1 Tax=Chondrus crispus TaxID=2769 RepID=R7QA59_CHOCR|nr:unnamed protein product [Chondrus crispus]CDF34355.1 unnamed protein product [Chondrus crispus]|eukprot:XP_005714174.1 unnamed protein product [Chondrus crispus]
MEIYSHIEIYGKIEIYGRIEEKSWPRLPLFVSHVWTCAHGNLCTCNHRLLTVLSVFCLGG